MNAWEGWVQGGGGHWGKKGDICYTVNNEDKFEKEKENVLYVKTV